MAHQGSNKIGLTQVIDDLDYFFLLPPVIVLILEVNISPLVLFDEQFFYWLFFLVIREIGSAERVNFGER